LDVFYTRKLLDVLQPRLQLQKLGKSVKLPKGDGKQVKWLRYSRISANTTALTEGVPPSDTSVSSANVTSTVAQYGDYSKVSDLLSDTAIDPVIENLAQLYGEAAADTIEQLIATELDANAFLKRVNDRASNATIVAGDVLSLSELIQATIDQKAAFIGPHEMGAFMVVVSPANEYDLKVATGSLSLLEINKYVSEGRMDIMKGEFARAYGMRFMTSDRMSSAADGSGGINTYNNYIIGQEAYGVVELDGNSLKMFRKKHGSAGAADPLDQYATVGYKIHGFAAKYLDASSKRVIQLRASSGV
jgi:N4-gp56 family major capsid protein